MRGPSTSLGMTPLRVSPPIRNLGHSPTYPNYYGLAGDALFVGTAPEGAGGAPAGGAETAGPGADGGRANIGGGAFEGWLPKFGPPGSPGADPGGVGGFNSRNCCAASLDQMLERY